MPPLPCPARRARRPFHPERLWSFLTRFWALQQVDALAEEEGEEGEGPATNDAEAPGVTLVCEPLTAEQAQQRQAALHSKFGQVRPGPRLQCQACCWVGALCASPAAAPAHPSTVSRIPPQVLRSKGFVWLGGRDDVSGDWSQAGTVLRIRCGPGQRSARLLFSSWPGCPFPAACQPERKCACPSPAHLPAAPAAHGLPPCLRSCGRMST